jgi:hypothetical protein
LARLGDSFLIPDNLFILLIKYLNDIYSARDFRALVPLQSRPCLGNFALGSRWFGMVVGHQGGKKAAALFREKFFH